MSCIFCKIISGEIPSYKVYEDDNVIAFLDITQATKGHTLVVPKKHKKNIYDIDEKTISDVYKTIPKIAKGIKKAFNPIGLNILNNNDAPLQSVFHYHVHLIPRYDGDELIINLPNNIDKQTNIDFLETANLINKAIRD